MLKTHDRDVMFIDMSDGSTRGGRIISVIKTDICVMKQLSEKIANDTHTYIY